MGPSPFQQKQKLQSSNPHFLSLTISPDNNKMHAEIFVPSALALNRWSSNLIKLASSQPEHILVPKEYQIIQKTTCGEGVMLEIEYDCYYIALSHEIDKRCDCEKYLEEAEMWYLIFCLCEAAVCLQRLGERIGDVVPVNILLNRQGKLKILSKLSVPNYCDPVIDSSKRGVYLSPQELEIIQKGFKECTLDFVAAESFAIGMTVLSAGTLQQLENCYNYNKAELNKIQFNKVLSFWEQNEFYSQFQKKKTHYSHKLKSLVNGLLQINPTKRKTSIQIYSMLKPYQSAIMKMEPFDLEARKLSPKKLDWLSKKEKPEVIHVLRSKKKNQSRLSPIKDIVVDMNQKAEDKSIDLGLQFSFRSPDHNHSTNIKNMQSSISPPRKLKLANTFNLPKSSEDSK